MGNNKRGPHFYNRKIQVALLKRESTHSPVTKNRKNPKRIANTTPFLSCVPYTNKHSLAKNLFSDRFTQTTNILSRILMRSSLEQYRDITKSRNEHGIPDSFRHSPPCVIGKETHAKAKLWSIKVIKKNDTKAKTTKIIVQSLAPEYEVLSHSNPYEIRIHCLSSHRSNSSATSRMRSWAATAASRLARTGWVSGFNSGGSLTGLAASQDNSRG